MVAEKWGIAVEQQRFWMWATRQNRSVRPSTPLAPSSDENRVCDIRVSVRNPQLLAGSGTVLTWGVTSCSTQVYVFQAHSIAVMAGLSWSKQGLGLHLQTP